MIAWLRAVDRQALSLSAIICIMLGLYFSPAAMSIGMIALLANALLNERVGVFWRRWRRHPALLGLTGIFFIYLVSGWNSSDTAWWLDRLRMKLPFLILPFAILSIPRFDAKVYYRLLYGFFWLTALLCVYSLTRYALEYAAITEQYREGRIMPTPVMHIRFSLLVAYAVAAGWVLFEERFYLRWYRERYALLAGAIFMAAYLHILAVRSGLLGLYAVLVYFLLRAAWRSRRYWRLLGASILLVASAYAAYRFLPTLKNKVDYSLYNWRLFQGKQRLPEYSDIYRLGSIEAGWDAAKRHFWTGVGVGDIKRVCDEYYATHYPTLTGLGLMPHNQYLFAFAAAGIFGMMYLCWATFYPLCYRRAYRQPLIVSFHLILLLSFMVEHTIETQLGTAIYCLFVLLGIRYQDENQPTGGGIWFKSRP
jgi:O-antigen ligase